MEKSKSSKKLMEFVVPVVTITVSILLARAVGNYWDAQKAKKAASTSTTT